MESSHAISGEALLLSLCLSIIHTLMYMFSMNIAVLFKYSFVHVYHAIRTFDSVTDCAL